MNIRVACLGIVALLTSVQNAQAIFHLWEIQEVFSNSDGTVQFIELFTTFNTQQSTSGQTITTNAKMFVFPSNSPAPTANHHLLLATAGFGSLPGGVTPNFTIPGNFFSPQGDTITFIGADTVTFASLPTNGSDSLHFSGLSSTVGPNTPTNYAGNQGSVFLIPPLTGDLDCDGDTDFDDIDDFVLGLNDPAAYEAQFGVHPALKGDTDGDDDLDFDDIVGFVDILSSGAVAVPEPPTVYLLAGLPLLFACRWRAPSTQWH
jgi:hypothetical protein